MNNNQGSAGNGFFVNAGWWLFPFSQDILESVEVSCCEWYKVMSTVSPDKDKLCNFSALDMLQNIFHTYQLGMEYFSALDKPQNIFHKLFFYE